jgi:aldehyde decarbonylase
MPIYDYVYGTMDKSSDSLYETSLKRPEDSPDVVHLTHLTTLESICHLRLGFASLASKPHTSKLYFWLMWPVTVWSLIITWIYGHTFVVEANNFEKIKWQSWVVPRYTIQVKKYILFFIFKIFIPTIFVVYIQLSYSACCFFSNFFFFC